jgi:hypothetical protein
MKRRNKRDEQKQLAENTYLLRAWKRWHREQLEEALIGLHSDVLVQLMIQLKHLREAHGLLNFIEAQDWTAIDAETRATALHEIDDAIVKLREQNGLAPIDDALPDERTNVFLLIKDKLFPHERENALPDAHGSGHQQMEKRHE